MPTTRNDLPDNARKSMIALLNARLADTIDLRLAVKQAHWNVKGPSFIALHELFDQIQARIDTFADDIAERAVALGGVVVGTSQAVSKDTKLDAYPASAIDEKAHLTALAERLAAYGKLARAAIDAADEAGDKDTADLFTGVSRQIDKDLWFIEAHLQ
jgi:starvation-inducible DNA-binding protein